MKKHILLLSVFLLFGTLPGFAVEPAPVSSPMKIETFHDQLFFVTIRIETKLKDGIGVSTGFVVEYPVDKDKRLFFLVTNRHAVEQAETGKFFFMRSDGANPILGERYDININNFKASWFGHPDPGIDVAIMPLGPVLSEIDRKGWKIFFKSIPVDVFTSDREARELDAIEEIIFVGYPNGLFDVKNYLPVARKGTTATPLMVDYNGRPEFMIDASVFLGSSGSPVFLSRQPSGPGTSERPYFLGLVSGAAFRAESGTIDFMKSPDQSAAVFNYNQLLNLGVVVKARAVAETITDWVNRNKVSLIKEVGLS